MLKRRDKQTVTQGQQQRKEQAGPAVWAGWVEEDSRPAHWPAGLC